MHFDVTTLSKMELDALVRGLIKDWESAQAEKGLEPAEAVRQLNELHGCPEGNHYTADQILLDVLQFLGQKSVVKAYLDCKKRVSFWYA